MVTIILLTFQMLKKAEEEEEEKKTFSKVEIEMCLFRVKQS